MSGIPRREIKRAGRAPGPRSRVLLAARVFYPMEKSNVLIPSSVGARNIGHVSHTGDLPGNIDHTQYGGGEGGEGKIPPWENCHEKCPPWETGSKRPATAREQEKARKQTQAARRVVWEAAGVDAFHRFQCQKCVNYGNSPQLDPCLC